MIRAEASPAVSAPNFGVWLAARLRRTALRLLCRRTRSLRRSLRQFTREIYICP